jgi:hypothetical protein
VALVLRERVGCNPGVFFTWQDKEGGALWPRTPLGSTIRAWTVDVDGTLIFIGAATNEQADADLIREVEQIVRSIRFEA